MSATTDSIDESRALRLRNQLADWISGRGTFQTPGVQQVFSTASWHEQAKPDPITQPGLGSSGKRRGASLVIAIRLA